MLLVGDDHFTIAETIVGLFIILGLFTWLMNIGVFGLATGILLGSGWLRITCLDEWQIGALDMSTGFTIFFTGGGRYSLDHYFQKRYCNGSVTIELLHIALVSIGPNSFLDKIM